MNRPYPTIDDVTFVEFKGPWRTKSDGELNVLLALTQAALKTFLHHESTDQSPVDTHGLRIYKVSDLSKGSVGANEWHRIRNEYTFVTKGVVSWRLQDKNNEYIEYTLTPSNGGIIIPHHIMHTYKALEDDTEIVVIANTLFNPEDASTHDTYPFDTFSQP